MLNSFAFEAELPTTELVGPASVNPWIDIGSLTDSAMPRLVISEVRAGGTRGTLKKPNTSRYSSSFAARFRDGIAAADDSGRSDSDEWGWRDMRKSKSNAQRRISARIFTVDGVERSPSVVEDCWYSPYSSRTRCKIEL